MRSDVTGFFRVCLHFHLVFAPHPRWFVHHGSHHVAHCPLLSLSILVVRVRHSSIFNLKILIETGLKDVANVVLHLPFVMAPSLLSHDGSPKEKMCISARGKIGLFPKV